MKEKDGRNRKLKRGVTDGGERGRESEEGEK